MNTPDRHDYEIKRARIAAYMDAHGYGAVILARRENFAWFTCGGDNKVLRNLDEGFGVLLITKEKVYLIAQYMDLDRIYDDELQGLGIEKVCLKWFEDSREERALKMAEGLRVVSDIALPGADQQLWDIWWLHYPLTENEISRYKAMCRLVDKMLLDVATRIRPGMTEIEIEAEIAYEYAKQGMLAKVLLVGSDERIAKYRHPVASNKKVEKLVLLHPAAEQHGLHANITRMVYFGDSLPDDLNRKYELLNLLQAQAMAMTIPGRLFSDLFDVRKQLLTEHDFGDEWQYHYPGGFTGYYLGSAAPFMNGERIRENMPTDYFITLTGAKTEELCISGAEGGVLISSGYEWPTRTYEWNGIRYNLPTILMR